jgi:hypothetical protein
VVVYKEQLSFNPNKIFLNIDFDRVKSEIKKQFVETEDYGSVILTKRDSFVVSINDIGKVIVLYDHLPKEELETVLGKIEKSFKKSVSSFELEKV